MKSGRATMLKTNASANDENANPLSQSSVGKVSANDESFTLAAAVGEDSTLAEKRNEFQEAIAKAQSKQQDKKMFDEKSESSTWEVKETTTDASKPLTDPSPINVDATAIEKQTKKKDSEDDDDEPLRMIGSAPVKSASEEPAFSKQLSKTVKALVVWLV